MYTYVTDDIYINPKDNKMNCKTPVCLKQQQEWLRASEVTKIFPLALSTLWDWAKKGKLHPVKVSTRVTVFSAKELQELFTYGDKNLQNAEPQPRKKRRKRKQKVKTEVSTPVRTKKTTFRKVQSKSHEELMEEYNSRKSPRSNLINNDTKSNIFLYF